MAVRRPEVAGMVLLLQWFTSTERIMSPDEILAALAPKPPRPKAFEPKPIPDPWVRPLVPAGKTLVIPDALALVRPRPSKLRAVLCVADGCNLVPLCRGYCRHHYHRWRTYGHP